MGQKAQEARKLSRALIQLLVTHMPGPAGERLRRGFWGTRLKRLGSNVLIDVGVEFVNPQHITLEDDCWIDKYAILMAGPPDEGERKLVRRSNPDFPSEEGEIVVGRGCHIGAQAVVNGHGGTWIGTYAGLGQGQS